MLTAIRDAENLLVLRRGSRDMIYMDFPQEKHVKKVFVEREVRELAKQTVDFQKKTAKRIRGLGALRQRRACSPFHVRAG